MSLPDTSRHRLRQSKTTFQLRHVERDGGGTWDVPGTSDTKVKVDKGPNPGRSWVACRLPCRLHQASSEAEVPNGKSVESVSCARVRSRAATGPAGAPGTWSRPSSQQTTAPQLRTSRRVEGGRSGRRTRSTPAPCRYGGKSHRASRRRLTYNPFVAQEQAEFFGELLGHYQAPLLEDDDVYMEFKTGTYISCDPPGAYGTPGCGSFAWDRQIWNERRLRWKGSSLVEMSGISKLNSEARAGWLLSRRLGACLSSRALP